MRYSSSAPVDAAAGPRKRARVMEEVREIDLRDYELLRRFMSEHGRILPTRFTGTTPKQQRRVAQAIKRARAMGLLK